MAPDAIAGAGWSGSHAQRVVRVAGDRGRVPTVMLEPIVLHCNTTHEPHQKR
jgi:hypothetical protein